MRLYTIPYAGGFAFTYLKWRKYLDKKIKLCSIELPGRGTRIEETACNSIEEMAEDVLQHIETEEEEYALFGHSMGAYVLLELYAKIHNRNKTLPKNIFISAMKPPHMYKSEGYHMLNNEKFRDKMCSMGGIPRQINEDIEFSDHFYGLLRNDLKAVEEYSISTDFDSFSCHVSLFNSESDIGYDNIVQWDKYSKMPCSYYSFQGSHFFINEHVSKTVCRINDILC